MIWFSTGEHNRPEKAIRNLQKEGSWGQQGFTRQNPGGNQQEKSDQELLRGSVAQVAYLEPHLSNFEELVELVESVKGPVELPWTVTRLATDPRG